MPVPFYEIVHIRKDFIRSSLPQALNGLNTVLTNIKRLIDSGADVHFLEPGQPLDEVMIDNPPKSVRPIILGGAYSNNRQGGLIQCVDRRLVAWQTIRSSVLVEPRITLYLTEDYESPKEEIIT